MGITAKEMRYITDVDPGRHTPLVSALYFETCQLLGGGGA